MPSVQPPRFDGLITIDSTNDSFTIRGNVTGIDRAITLTQGDYFIAAYSGELTASQLTGMIQAAVRAAPGVEFDAFTCQVGIDTGLINMSNAAEAFTVTGAEWYPGSGGLGRILGYTGNLTPAATSFTSPNQHKFGWYPNVPPVDFSGDPDLLGVRLSDAVGTTAPDGTQTTTAYNNRRVRDFMFEHIQDEYMFPTGSPLVLNRDFEQFWTDILRVGRRWRYYPDRTVTTAPGGGAPWIYVGGKTIAKDGTTAADRQVGFWSAFYKITIDALEYVG